jgi:hypothetical protein
MSVVDTLSHTTSIEVGAPAQISFAFMADGMKMGQWAFGSWDRRHVEDDLFVGTSMFSGNDVYVRMIADPDRLLIHYEVGPSPDTLAPRVIARVVPGPELGYAEGRSIVTLVLWRDASMSDENWSMIASAHETEMYIIRRLIESGQ